MTAQHALSTKAEELMERLGLSYEHLLGLRFAVNVFIATIIVWFTLEALQDTNPLWAIASMVAAADPEPEQARRLFRNRLINVLVGCAVGFCVLLVGGRTHWMIPLGPAIAVLVSCYLVRIQVMWRQAPITAVVVIAAGIVGSSIQVGIGRGLHKVGEVIFGCIVGIMVSWFMSKIWLVKRPTRQAGPAGTEIP